MFLLLFYYSLSFVHQRQLSVEINKNLHVNTVDQNAKRAGRKTYCVLNFLEEKGCPFFRKTGDTLPSEISSTRKEPHYFTKDLPKSLDQKAKRATCMRFKYISTDLISSWTIINFFKCLSCSPLGSKSMCCWGGIDWESGTDVYTLLYLKIDNQQAPTV